MKLNLKNIETDNFETAILASFVCVTPSDCQGWVKDSQVYTNDIELSDCVLYLLCNSHRACTILIVGMGFVVCQLALVAVTD